MKANYAAVEFFKTQSDAYSLQVTTTITILLLLHYYYYYYYYYYCN